jgi:hypothetical protein
MGHDTFFIVSATPYPSKSPQETKLIGVFVNYNEAKEKCYELANAFVCDLAKARAVKGSYTVMHRTTESFTLLASNTAVGTKAVFKFESVRYKG